MNSTDSARYLGYAGLIPFFGMALGALFSLEPAIFVAALLGYGAVILSFLGGVVWGRAVSAEDAARAADYIVSVMPSLAGWVALIIGGTAGLLLCAAGFAAMLVFDMKGALPDWFARLRLHLSLGAIAACLLGALAI